MSEHCSSPKTEPVVSPADVMSGGMPAAATGPLTVEARRYVPVNGVLELGDWVPSRSHLRVCTLDQTAPLPRVGGSYARGPLGNFTGTFGPRRVHDLLAKHVRMFL